MMQRRVVLLLCVLGFAPPLCHAGLFDNQEQQAGKLFGQGDYGAAAETFTDSYRRGVAQYRAGRYEQAAESFEQVQRESVKTDALYNLGNSRFRQDRLEDAAEAWRQVLLRDPEHEDARHNLGLASAMLAEASREEEQKQREQNRKEQEKEKEEQQEQQEQEQSGEETSEQQQASGDQQQDEQQQSGEQQSDQQQASGKQQDEQQQSGDEASEQQQASGKQQAEDEQQHSGDQQSDQQQAASKQQQDEQQQSGDEASDQQQAAGKQQQDELRQYDDEASDQQQAAGKQQRQSEDGEPETEGISGRYNTADQSDGAGEAAEQERAGSRSAVHSDTGNDEASQNQSSIAGADPTLEATGAGEHGDDAHASGADSGVRNRAANGSNADFRQAKRGAEQQTEDAPAGSNRDSRGPRTGIADDPGDFDPARVNMNTGAIEQFDQLGRQDGLEDGNAPLPGDVPGRDRRSMILVMEQLLDQVEGDPTQLMRNQFMLEEQRMDQNSGRLYEPRPW